MFESANGGMVVVGPAVGEVMVSMRIIVGGRQACDGMGTYTLQEDSRNLLEPIDFDDVVASNSGSARVGSTCPA